MIDKALLTTTDWIHSHEEDGTDESARFLQYRPADFRFPLSRGRRGYRFHTDGTLALIAPGASDRQEVQQGAWQVEGDRIIISLPGQTIAWQVISFDKQGLRLLRD